MSEFESGACGSFRFEVIPDIRVGVVHLERLRPWPACTNPDTGRQWSQDMKDKIFEVKNINPSVAL
jgi:hypothetical protein